MKKVALLFLLLAVIILNFASAAYAVSMTATITADNHYGLYLGSANTITAYIGANEVNATGSPGLYNWSLPETFVFDVSPGDYIYVAGWSDDSVAQGWIGQFVTPSSTILSNEGNWEVFLTCKDLDDGSAAPSAPQLGSDIASAAWGKVDYSIDHGQDPWGYIPGISLNADWIWGSALLGGSDFGEYQIFRTQVNPVPEPATMLLLGSGLIGLATFGRKKLLKK